MLTALAARTLLACAFTSDSLLSRSVDYAYSALDIPCAVFLRGFLLAGALACTTETRIAPASDAHSYSADVEQCAC